MTPRLYHDDPLLTRFDAVVVSHGSLGDRPTLVLDRTAFYPESGGQMADRGTLAGLPVLDVQQDAEGLVHHLLEGALPAPGAAIEGRVAEERRREHMALHTGQHLLSRALLDVAGARTLSSRLGERACTLDVGEAALGERDIARAEDLVNAIVDEDRVVRAHFPSSEELAALDLRAPAKEHARVRVVEVTDFDVTPCGGTHVTHTAAVGLLRVTKVERYKQGLRLTFTAGRRARRALFEQAATLDGLARRLTCAAGEIGDVLDKLDRNEAALREELGRVRAELAEALAERLEEGAAGATRLAFRLEGRPVELARAVLSRLATGERVVLLAAADADGLQVVVGRGPDAHAHAGQLLRALADAHDGRGGGRPDRAEGRFPATTDWDALRAHFEGRGATGA